MAYKMLMSPSPSHPTSQYCSLQTLQKISIYISLDTKKVSILVILTHIPLVPIYITYMQAT